MMTVELQQELASFINRNSLENGCDMPDFAIAAYLAQCYQALCIAAESHVNWRQEPIMPCLCHIETPDGMGLACSVEHRDRPTDAEDAETASGVVGTAASGETPGEGT